MKECWLTLLSFFAWDWWRKNRWQKIIAVAIVTWGLHFKKYMIYLTRNYEEYCAFNVQYNNNISNHPLKNLCSVNRRTITPFKTLPSLSRHQIVCILVWILCYTSFKYSINSTLVIPIYYYLTKKLRDKSINTACSHRWPTKGNRKLS
jgi:hypothetical protein